MNPHRRDRRSRSDAPPPSSSKQTRSTSTNPRSKKRLVARESDGPMSEAKDLTGLVGKHLIYTYANGWQYEIYVKNATHFSYRIHSGIVGGRWVTDQEAHMLDIGDN